MSTGRDPIGVYIYSSPSSLSSSLFKDLFIYLFDCSVHCCTWAFSRCGEQGLLLVAVHGLFIAVASLVELEL